MSTSVQVCVRVRPLIGREKVDRCDECLSVIEEAGQIIMGKDRAYTYDYVFGKYSSQGDLWRCVQPLIEGTFQGLNATIFAYGQTGSGKTYSMGSGSNVNVLAPERGILPRVIEYLFDQTQQRKDADAAYRVEIHVSFMEIYGEEIRDLLEGVGKTNKVVIRENELGDVHVVGATEECVETSEQCMRLLEKGTMCRTTASTLMNAHSSRSHAVFTLSMVQSIPMEPIGVEGSMEEDEEGCDNNSPNDPPMETRKSYLHIVDLAGSERQKKTKAEGKRLKEGIDINKGLLALGNVISALGDEKKRGKVHVPYRDSKLTRMLQDSLGGNSQTLMIACVSPADYNFEETLNSLKYAYRAKNIQNKPIVNREGSTAVLVQLRQEIQVLTSEVLRLRGGSIDAASLMTELCQKQSGDPFARRPSFLENSSSADLSMFRERCEVAEDEVIRLMNEIKTLRCQMNAVNENLISAHATRDMYRLQMEESGMGIVDEEDCNDEKKAKVSVFEENARKMTALETKLREYEIKIVQNERSIKAYTPRNDTTHHGTDTSNLIALANMEISKESNALSAMRGENEKSDKTSEFDEDGTNEAEEAEFQRVFQQRQQHLDTTVQDLAKNISVKEDLVMSLKKSQLNYERMKDFYNKKMQQMSVEVKQAQEDRETLLHEIRKTENKTDSEKSNRSVMLKRLKDKDEQLTALKKKQRDIQKFVSMKKKDDAQVRQLYTEISNMKRQRIDLMKKMQNEKKQYIKEASQRQREITGLQRTSKKDRQQLKKLGAEKEMHDRVMRQKLQNITEANRRLRQNQTGRHLNAEERKKKTWLTTQIKLLATKQENAEQLETELVKREDIVSQMEQLHGLRNRLQENLERSMTESNKANLRDVLISPQKPQHRRVLSPDEKQTLFELGERIGACQAQLEYKDDKISKMATGVVHDFDVAEDNVDLLDETSLEDRLESSSLPEARTLLKILFEMAVSGKKSNHLKKTSLLESEEHTREVVKEVESLRDQLQYLRMNSEADVVKMQQDQEEKMTFYIDYYNSMQSSSSSSHPAAPLHPTRDNSKAPQTRRSTELLLSLSEEKNEVLKKRVLSDERKYHELKKIHIDLKKKHAYANQNQNSNSDSPGASRSSPAPSSTTSISYENTIKSVPNNSPVKEKETVVLDSSIATCTEETSGDIFNRLANPTNFTGTHKNRIKDGASGRRKKDELLHRDHEEKLRVRRLRDRRIAKSSESRPLTAPSIRKQRLEDVQKYLTPVHEILGKLSTLKSNPPSFIEKLEAPPPPPPLPVHPLEDHDPDGNDVYTRLAGHYTESSQQKRHKMTRGGKIPGEKSSVRTSLESVGSETSNGRRRSYSASDEIEMNKIPNDWETPAEECHETSSPTRSNHHEFNSTS